MLIGHSDSGRWARRYARPREGATRGISGALGERERAALRVAADGPALAGVDDRAAELLDAGDRGRQVLDGQVGQRDAVARAGAALVEPRGGAAPLRLPAAALVGPAPAEVAPEQAGPEPPGPLGVVGGGLDEGERGPDHHADRIPGTRATPSQRLSAPSGW